MAKPKRLSYRTESLPSSHNTPSKRQTKIKRTTREQTRAVLGALLIDRIVAHWRRGEGFEHFHLLPDVHRGAADAHDRAYYDQARLLDIVTRIARAAAPSPKHTRANPTLGVLDDLIKRGVITHATLIADVMSANAHLLLIGGDRYVTGLGWPRLCIVRTPERLEPVFRAPAVRDPALMAEQEFVPGIREWTVVYYRPAPGEPHDRVPAYRVRLETACALRQCVPATFYSLTSGLRKDWALDRARLRPRDSTRELVFDGAGFWRWLHGHTRMQA